jgi:DNA primase
MSFKKNKFKCWSCGESGDTISLAMKVLGKDFTGAAKWLADEHNIILQTSSLRPQPSAISHQTSFDASRYARFFEHPWLLPEAKKFLFEERRLDERVVRWCRLTSWKDKLGVPWLQIPYYNCEGKLVGIQIRNLIKGALPRFRFPQGSQCGIYNLPVLNLLKPGDELYIAEGCSDCWSLLSAGHKAIAIPSATLLTRDVRSKMEEVRGRFSIQFHMWPDCDEPGERLFLQLQKVLPSLVHHQLPPTCKDFSEYYLNLNRRSSESHSSLLGNGRVASEEEQSSNMEPET